MTTSYTTTAAAVNPTFPGHLLNLLDLLRDLSARRGFAWPRNEWLAERLSCTERTITRQISILRRAGCVRTERVGNERHIFIAQNDAPETVKPTLRNPRHVYPMSTQCLPDTLESENRVDNNSSQAVQSPEVNAAPIVAALREYGVSAPVAAQLAAADPEQCRAQIDALDTRNGIRDAAATLVSAIKGKWSIRKKQCKQVSNRKNQRSASSAATREQAQENAALSTVEIPAAVRAHVIAALPLPLRRRAEQGKDQAIIETMCREQIKRDQSGNLPANELPPGHQAPTISDQSALPPDQYRPPCNVRLC